MVLNSNQINQFQTSILAWYHSAKRDLPWRRSRDPYAVWLSEIMLQQTRVAAAIPYYERFLSRFPTIEDLAFSSEQDLLQHWAGLGYYHRARNLQKAAKLMVERGGFPSTYPAIRALPGIGDYTASAVASISFNLPHAVLDGNVFRVLSRIANDATDIGSGVGKKVFSELAGALLNRSHPGDHNQALMELGATVCLPKNPQCLLCPVASFCVARAAGTQNQLPVKLKAQKSAPEHRTLFYISDGCRILLWQRPPEASLMPGFWEMPEQEQCRKVDDGELIGTFRHSITFHDYRFAVKRATAIEPLGPCTWIQEGDLEKLPLSTIARKALRLIAKRNVQKTLAASHA